MHIGAPTNLPIIKYTLYRTNELLTKVLAQIHDTKAGSAQFTSYFNGNAKNTIRFIFAIERFEIVSRFLDPDSLFIAIYNNVSDTIKPRFAQDKVTTITRQRAALADNASITQKEKAAMYSVESMQQFFMKHFRPSITRGNIFRHLLSIRMRYNENPREVLDRVVMAISNAKKTIKLYNSAGIGIALDKIRPADINHILTTVFCTKNNSTHEKNNGGINALVQQTIRKQQLVYINTTKYTNWYTQIDAICAKVSGAHYAGDELFKVEYHPPQILELWETPKYKPKPKPTKPKGRGGIKRKQPYPQSPYNPKTKYRRNSDNPYRQRPPKPNQPNPNTDKRSKPCFRCGRPGHRASDCYSRSDINGQTLQKHERRLLKEMPFRGDHKVPKSPPIKQPHQPYKPPITPIRYPTRNPHQFQNRSQRQNPNQQQDKWSKYPSQPTRPYPNPNPNTSSTNNQPQIHTLLAQIKTNAEQDSHINPSLLQQIQSLASMMEVNLDDSASGHHPQ